MQPDFSGGVLAVVVVNYGAVGELEENFAGLSGLPECRVVVVDNFSSAAERDRVSAACARWGWTPVLSETNQGFGEGVNAGLRVARDLGADAYLLINPDGIIMKRNIKADALEELLVNLFSKK